MSTMSAQERTPDPLALRDHLTLTYSELEERNLAAKQQRKDRAAAHQLAAERLEYLRAEKRIKAVTVLFSDLEGRLHMLDYDKKFLLDSHDNLTFDGSSIRGFTAQRESDLRLALDWSAFYWAPADVFGAGKVLVFADVLDREGRPFAGDIRGRAQTTFEQMLFRARLHAQRGQRDRGLSLPRARRGTPLSRNRCVRIRQHRRILSLASRRPVTDVYRHGRRSTARDGFPERERPSRSGAVAVRDQLQLRRSRRRCRSDPTLQAYLPPSGHAWV